MYISGGTSGNYITGMSSGMDVDTLVKNLMDAERVSYDSYYQEQQYYKWQLEAYQEVTSSVKTFQDTYLDYSNPSNNLLSASAYMDYNCESTDNSISTMVTNSSKADNQYILEVDQIATSSSIESDTTVSKAIEASQSVDYNLLDNQYITLILDGTEKQVLIKDNDNSSDITLEDIQTSIDDAFGEGKIVVSDVSGKLTLDTVDGSGSHELALSGADDVMMSLGFEADDFLSNRLDTIQSLKDISESLYTPFNFDIDGMITMTINNVLFEFAKETSLDQMMKSINSDSEAGVTMTYDALSDTFNMTADETGAGTTIIIEETESNFLTSTGLTTIEAGSDAVLTINGETVVRSDNTFEVDGVTFTVSDVTTSPVTLNVELNSEQIYETIANFVEEYNNMITSIQAELKEERDYDYEPLTQVQKDEMSDDEIEQWEEEAKVGLLSNDQILEDMLNEMRQALYMPVEGCELTLADIGIRTESYENGGQLIIDDTLLLSVIADTPESVVELFTQPSDTYPGTTAGRSLNASEFEVKQQEEGLMFRLYDISEKYVSTTSDTNGNTGLLIEKCGFHDDYTELSSSMYRQLEEMENRLLEMEDDLEEKEENYYSEFSVMETYISQMNSQLQMIQSWFT